MLVKQGHREQDHYTKSIAFLYTNSENLEAKIKTKQYHIAPKNMKCLDIKLVEHVRICVLKITIC